MPQATCNAVQLALVMYFSPSVVLKCCAWRARNIWRRQYHAPDVEMLRVAREPSEHLALLYWKYFSFVKINVAKK
jgi:hypothetical protein